MNSKVERQVAAKVFVEYLRKRFLNNITISQLKDKPAQMNRFADVNPQSDFAPHIEKAYELCLLHGRKTWDGQPENQEVRVFEPTSYITIAETIKVLVNM